MFPIPEELKVKLDALVANTDRTATAMEKIADALASPEEKELYLKSQGGAPARRRR